MLEPQNEPFVRDLLQFSDFVAPKSMFPCEFSYGPTSKSTFRARLPSIFITMSQNATPATEFARCRHFAQHWQCDSQKTRNTTRLKCCACHAKWHRRSPKCCACHQKYNAASENVAKVLRLPHKNTFDTSWNMLECHKVLRLPRNIKLRDAGNFQKWPLLQNLP